MIGPDGFSLIHVFTGIKAQVRRRCLQEIAARVARVTDLDKQVVARLFFLKEIRRSSAIGGGVAVLDLQTMRVKSPAFCLAVLEHGVDFCAPDGAKVDLVACLLSPHSDGKVHLQRISAVSRLFRDNALCDSIREAKNEDAIRILLMPAEKRLSAA